jgi:putative peptide zinc metalloprotease protein
MFALIPLGIIEFSLHELGHAFTVKYFGREVHYIGIGWGFSGPLAFTDTSDMWLAPRKPRMIVNLAGIVVDLTVAGIASLLIVLISNHYIQAVLWLFALYTYVGSFRMLSPMQDMDGYYLLVDYVEKNHLRHASVNWLIKKFPACLRNPRLFREYRPELIYWISCIVYLVAVTILTLVLQSFIFKILNVTSSNHYVSLILPFIVVLFTSLSIVAEVKSQAE